MKCYVCGNEFEGCECNICQFPVINFPGNDIEAGLSSIQPTIESYRNVFMQKIVIGITIYHWEYRDNALMHKKEKVHFGTAAELLEKVSWLAHDFEMVTRSSCVVAELYVEVNGGTQEEKQYAISSFIFIFKIISILLTIVRFKTQIL